MVFYFGSFSQRTVKGRCSLEFRGKEIRVRGKLVRIASLDAEGFIFLKDPEAALVGLRHSKGGADIFTFMQSLAETAPKYKYLMEWDNLAALPVSSYDHWITKQINFKVRNKVKKAIKSGIVTREVSLDDDLLRGIQAIYNESPIRQGRKFWHYGKDLETLRKVKSTYLDQSVFIGAYLEDNLVGFAKLVLDDDRNQAGLMHILAMIQHRDKAPTNALLAQAVRSCADRGISYLTYANFSYGKKQNSALAEFKRHNGFQKIELPRYYVPLNASGRIALKLGLHHDFIDMIPEPVAATYRKIRSVWYAGKFAGQETA
jgi:hypothetical protein